MPPPRNGFRPLTSLTAQWRQAEGPGLEHLTLEQHDDRIVATAAVTSADPQNPFGAWYHIFFNDRWQVKAVSVHRTDTRWFVAQSREPGSWCDADGGMLKKFDGCLDVDLSATPFTVTPAIRRLNLADGDVNEHDVLALPFDTFAPASARRRIACLKQGRLYRVENLVTGIATQIEIDQDGLALGPSTGFARVF